MDSMKKKTAQRIRNKDVITCVKLQKFKFCDGMCIISTQIFALLASMIPGLSLRDNYVKINGKNKFKPTHTIL